MTELSQASSFKIILRKIPSVGLRIFIVFSDFCLCFQIAYVKLHSFIPSFYPFAGYTHRMRLIPFAWRYFVHDEQMDQKDALDIVQSYQKTLTEGESENPGKIMYIGRKHVFFR